VKAQLAAARKRGIQEWILWDPSVTYTTAALPRPRDRTGGSNAGKAADDRDGGTDTGGDKKKD